MSCIPKETDSKELTLTQMMEERKLWSLLDGYGSDSMYCISPPLVSEETKQVYDLCVSSCKQGTFSVPERDQFVYEQYNQCYPGDE